MIRTVIVDDVALARESIRIRLGEHKDFDVVGEAANAAEGLSLIRELAPQLVFLDIEMPGSDAFQLLERLDPAELPELIFVTAHDNYAVQAFNADAVHYLLKPINDDQFDEAIRRARIDVEAKPGRGQTISPPSPYWSRLPIKDRDRFVLVKTDDINWIGSAANYSEIHVGDRSYLLRMPISDLELRLDPSRLARISRSTIVHIDAINDIKTLWHGDFEVLLKDGTALRMSRRYRSRLLSPR